MISDEEPEPGPALRATFAGRKRKRTDIIASPRSPKRVAAGSDSSVTEEETDSEAGAPGDRFSDPESSDEIVRVVQPFPPFEAGVDDDHPLQYIDVPPSASTSASTSSLALASLPQSPSPAPDPEVLPSTSGPIASSSQPRQPSPTPHTPDLLSEYTCPICFSQPSNATLTPCGHICCGSCLFTAVKTTLHRGAMGFSREPNVAR